MAETLGTAYVQIVPSMNGVGTSISKAFNTGSLGSVGNNAGMSIGSNFASGFGKFAGTAALAASAAVAAVGVAVTGLATKAVTSGIAFNSSMEQYDAAFTTMLGSAEESDKLMANLQTFAAKTPFEMEPLAKATQTLIQFGSTSEEAQHQLKVLGDISMGDSSKLSGLAIVLGQVQSAGKLTGQDLMQMINQGFNPLQVMSETTGKSMAELRDEMGKGQISYEMVAEAMEGATSEGGQFYNAMDTMSRTFAGQMSTFKDGVDILTGSLTKGLTDTLTSSVMPAANEFVDTLMAMANGEEGAAEKMPQMADNLAKAIVGMIPEINNIVSQVMSVGGQVLSALGKSLMDNMPQLMSQGGEMLMGIVSGIIESLPEIIQAGSQILTDLLTGLKESLPVLLPQILDGARQLLLDTATQLFMAIVEAIPLILDLAITALGELLTWIIEGISPYYDQMLQAAADFIANLALGIGEGVTGAITAIGDVINGAIGAVGDFFQDMYDAAGDLINGLVSGISDGARAVIDAIGGVINGAIDWGKSLLGIASPSKVFAGIGENTIQGMANGILSSKRLLTDAMGRAIGGLTSMASPTLGVALRGVSANSIPSFARTSALSNNIVLNINATNNDAVARETQAYISKLQLLGAM